MEQCRTWSTWKTLGNASPIKIGALASVMGNLSIEKDWNWYLLLSNVVSIAELAGADVHKAPDDILGGPQISHTYNQIVHYHFL